jgi:hypothetical protein
VATIPSVLLPGRRREPADEDARCKQSNQDARSATHKLQLTPLAENWTP